MEFTNRKQEKNAASFLLQNQIAVSLKQLEILQDLYRSIKSFYPCWVATRKRYA